MKTIVFLAICTCVLQWHANARRSPMAPRYTRRKTCVACHGKDGKKTLDPRATPRLPVKTRPIIEAQMKDIKSGARANGSSAAMKGMMHLVSQTQKSRNPGPVPLQIAQLIQPNLKEFIKMKNSSCSCIGHRLNHHWSPAPLVAHPPPSMPGIESKDYKWNAKMEGEKNRGTQTQGCTPNKVKDGYESLRRMPPALRSGQTRWHLSPAWPGNTPQC
jgi:cytochrome c